MTSIAPWSRGPAHVPSTRPLPCLELRAGRQAGCRQVFELLELLELLGSGSARGAPWRPPGDEEAQQETTRPPAFPLRA